MTKISKNKKRQKGSRRWSNDLVRHTHTHTHANSDNANASWDAPKDDITIRKAVSLIFAQVLLSLPAAIVLNRHRDGNIWWWRNPIGASFSFDPLESSTIKCGTFQHQQINRLHHFLSGPQSILFSPLSNRNSMLHLHTAWTTNHLSHFVQSLGFATTRDQPILGRANQNAAGQHHHFITRAKGPHRKLTLALWIESIREWVQPQPKCYPSKSVGSASPSLVVLSHI